MPWRPSSPAHALTRTGSSSYRAKGAGAGLAAFRAGQGRKATDELGKFVAQMREEESGLLRKLMGPARNR